MPNHAGSADQLVTFLYTAALAQTAAFEQALGLVARPRPGACRIYRARGDAFGFCTRDDAPRNPQGVILTLVSQDVDGWYERLCGQGMAFEKPPAHNPKFNIYHCFLRDPNGYLIEIQTFLDPAWPAPAARG